jgi:hypothetical protein
MPIARHAIKEAGNFSGMRGNQMTRLSMLLGCALLSTAAGAADLYRWVDESGHTHVSDSVPARYQDVATKVDTSSSEVSESRRQEALARAAREKQLVEESEKVEQSVPLLPPVRTEMPAVPDSGETECDRLIRAYRESQECFAPFQRRRGGTRPEAYRYCTPVQSPYAQCGLPSQY